MSVGENSGPIHPIPTERSGYRYQFYVKHHGRDPGASQWLPTMTADEEFDVFNTADRLELSDDKGKLYGLRSRTIEGLIQALGTRGQQIAVFPRSRPNEAWHGYPIWPSGQKENRGGEVSRPSKTVFMKMVAAGLLTPREYKRLEKGDPL